MTEPIVENLASKSATTIECCMKLSRGGRRTPFFPNKKLMSSKLFQTRLIAKRNNGSANL